MSRTARAYENSQRVPVRGMPITKTLMGLVRVWVSLSMGLVPLGILRGCVGDLSCVQISEM